MPSQQTNELIAMLLPPDIGSLHLHATMAEREDHARRIRDILDDIQWAVHQIDAGLTGDARETLRKSLMQHDDRYQHATGGAA